MKKIVLVCDGCGKRLEAFDFTNETNYEGEMKLFENTGWKIIMTHEHPGKMEQDALGNMVDAQGPIIYRHFCSKKCFGDWIKKQTRNHPTL